MRAKSINESVIYFETEDELVRYAKKAYPHGIDANIIRTLHGRYGEKLQNSLLDVTNSDELHKWIYNNYEIVVNEMIQKPFSNNTKNLPISGSYPLSKIQYEDADKLNQKLFTKNDLKRAFSGGRNYQLHLLKFEDWYKQNYEK